MPLLSKILSFWRNIFRKRKVEQDLHDELLAYVDELAERKIQAGLSPEAARQAALLELGGMDRIQELVRQQRVGFASLRGAGITLAVAIIAFIGGLGVATSMGRRNEPPASSPTRPTAVQSRSVAASREKVPVLEGRVLDKSTGRPLPGVEVGLQPWPLIRRFTYTDDNGHFIFRSPPSQGYFLTAGALSWRVEGDGGTMPPYPMRDYFELASPTSISVSAKSGAPLEGEPIKMNGVLFKGGRFERELRRFSYATSVVELRAENVPPGQR